MVFLETLCSTPAGQQRFILGVGIIMTTEFTNLLLTAAYLSVLVILHGRYLSHAVAAHCPLVFYPREVCSHEKRGCYKYPTAATDLPSHLQIDSDVPKRVPSMILFTCLIGLKWVAVGALGRGLSEGYWWGHRASGIVTQRGASIWGVGLTGERKYSHLASSVLTRGPSEQSNEVQITAQDCKEQASIVCRQGALNVSQQAAGHRPLLDYLVCPCCLKTAPFQRFSDQTNTAPLLTLLLCLHPSSVQPTHTPNSSPKNRPNLLYCVSTA